MGTPGRNGYTDAAGFTFVDEATRARLTEVFNEALHEEASILDAFDDDRYTSDATFHEWVDVPFSPRQVAAPRRGWVDLEAAAQQKGREAGLLVRERLVRSAYDPSRPDPRSDREKPPIRPYPLPPGDAALEKTILSAMNDQLWRGGSGQYLILANGGSVSRLMKPSRDRGGSVVQALERTFGAVELRRSQLPEAGGFAIMAVDRMSGSISTNRTDGQFEGDLTDDGRQPCLSFNLRGSLRMLADSPLLRFDAPPATDEPRAQQKDGTAPI